MGQNIEPGYSLVDCKEFIGRFPNIYICAPVRNKLRMLSLDGLSNGPIFVTFNIENSYIPTEEDSLVF